jgi:hypothetical protein
MTIPADPPDQVAPRRRRLRGWSPPAAGLALVPALALAVKAVAAASKKVNAICPGAAS